MYRRAKVRELLAYLGTLKGMKRAAARHAGDQWLERVGLSEVADQRVESLSKGMTQKVQIAACLMNDPELCAHAHRSSPGRRRRQEPALASNGGRCVQLLGRLSGIFGGRSGRIRPAGNLVLYPSKGR